VHVVYRYDQDIELNTSLALCFSGGSTAVDAKTSNAQQAIQNKFVVARHVRGGIKSILIF
jgi:hypothetical protein